MTWVLIVMLNWGAVTFTSEPFKTERACEVERARIEKLLERGAERAGYEDASTACERRTR
jgi:hypothetical protein